MPPRKRVDRLVVHESRDSSSRVITLNSHLNAAGKEIVNNLIALVVNGRIDSLHVHAREGYVRKDVHVIAQRERLAHETTRGVMRIFNWQRSLAIALCHMRRNGPIYAVVCSWMSTMPHGVRWTEAPRPARVFIDSLARFQEFECDQCGSSATLQHWGGLYSCDDCSERGEFEGMKWEEI